MNAKQILLVAALAALAPLAQAKQIYGEAYPLDIVETPSILTRAEVREEVLALDRRGQHVGEAFPYQVMDPMTMRLLAEVRREARTAPRMYGELSGDAGHN